jgi:hypothetical protein
MLRVLFFFVIGIILILSSLILAADSATKLNQLNEMTTIPSEALANNLNFGWQFIDSSGPKRGGPGFSYDRILNKLVLCNGEMTGTELIQDTWEWNLNEWQFVTYDGPGPRANFLMVYDDARQNSILFGGWTHPDSYLGDTWIWDGLSWSLRDVPAPSPRANCAFAYDIGRQRVVLFGGSYYQTIFNETWEWDGTSWELRSSEGPPPRIFPRMAYDAKRGKCVLFGGQSSYDGETFGDTWEWDGYNWVQIDVQGPEARLWHMMANDPIREKVLLYGGVNRFDPADIFYNDTWEFDGISWSKVVGTGLGSRWDAGMTFHEGLGKIVLYGGAGPGPLSGFPVYGDMWVYPGFICGDADGNGVINLLDITYIINFLYKNGSAPKPPAAGDANGNGATNISDITYLINFLYKQGLSPVCP